MRNRVRVDPRSAIDELYAKSSKVSSSTPGASTLLKTVTAITDGPVALNNLTPTTIVTAPVVTIAAGQKVIIWTAVEYDGGSGNGTSNTVTQIIQDATPTTHDTVEQSVFAVDRENVARVLELGSPFKSGAGQLHILGHGPGQLRFAATRVCEQREHRRDGRHGLILPT